MSKLRVENLTIHYSTVTTPIVDDVSFSLTLGDSVLLAGASGCGKSTLALALAGLIPRAVEADIVGRVVLDEVDITTLPPGASCQRVGMVFQDPEAQFCMLTVEDEIAFGLENIDIPRGEIANTIAHALSVVGMEKHRHTRIDRLSGGLKQKLALACIIAQNPPIIIFDEPTANLDPASTENFFQLVGRIIAKRQQIVVLIEHKLEIPALFVDRVMVLERGRIVEFASAREVFAARGELLKDLGVWQPYATEIAQSLQKKDINFHPFPLTIKELCQAATNDTLLSSLLIQEIKSQVRTKRQERSKQPLVSFDQVSFAYKNGFTTTKVIDDVSLEIKKGSFTALVGENGAGKSTLARLALGLMPVTNGTVKFNAKLVRKIPRKRLAQLAGLVFQNPEHQFITDTVWDEVAFSLQLAGQSQDEIVGAVNSLLAEFKLDERADANPFSLSQGEKRRLSVAAMLGTGQELLILDELSFGQDYINTYRLMDLVLQRQTMGCTIVMITHDMRLVWEYATEIAVLHQGKLRYTGSVQELFHKGEVTEKWSLRLPPALQVIQNISLDQGVR